MCKLAENWKSKKNFDVGIKSGGNWIYTLMIFDHFSFSCATRFSFAPNLKFLSQREVPYEILQYPAYGFLTKKDKRFYLMLQIFFQTIVSALIFLKFDSHISTSV